MNRYRLKQNGLIVAFAMGNEAEREIMHYAMIYAQDGPVTVERRAANGKWKVVKR